MVAQRDQLGRPDGVLVEDGPERVVTAVPLRPLAEAASRGPGPGPLAVGPPLGPGGEQIVAASRGRRGTGR